MTKQQIIALIILCTVAFTGTVGGVVAYMIKISQEKESTFQPAQVSCTLNETATDNQKTAITVTNTSNIDVFVRVRLVTYWVDANSNVVANKAPADISFTFDNTVWVKDEASNTYYCCQSIAAGATTDNLLKGQTLALNSEDGCKQVIDVFAEVIQSNPANAAEDSWNVTVTNGKIASVQ